MSAERNLIKTPYYSPWFSSSSTASTHNDGRLLALLPLALDQLGEGVGAGGGVVATGLVREAPNGRPLQPQSTAAGCLITQSQNPSLPRLHNHTQTKKSKGHTYLYVLYVTGTVHPRTHSYMQSSYLFIDSWGKEWFHCIVRQTPETR